MGRGLFREGCTGTLVATGTRQGCGPPWCQLSNEVELGSSWSVSEVARISAACARKATGSRHAIGDSYKARQLDRGEGPSCLVSGAEVWLSVSRAWAAAARRLLLKGLAKGSITGFGSRLVGKVGAGLGEECWSRRRHAKSAGGTVGGQGLSGAGRWSMWRQPDRARSTLLTSFPVAGSPN